MTRALITGAFGQDGSYLARLLLDKGYTVYGTTRDVGTVDRGNLRRLGIADRFEAVTMQPNRYDSVLEAIEHTRPDEIYSLAGQSSVALSFKDPLSTLDSIVLSTLHLLEAIRRLGGSIRFYNAGSSECFGSTDQVPATEDTPFHPRSPYGVAKASAHMLVRNYRESYAMFAANGILFNHESPLRPERFVTRKITAAARRIADGSSETLTLGRLDIVRDWGWAPDYVDAMWRMLQLDKAEDFIVATGRSVPLADFVAAVFATFDLDWRNHVISDPQFGRPSDLDWSGGDARRAAERLGWRASVAMPEVARRMALAEGAGLDVLEATLRSS